MSVSIIFPSFFILWMSRQLLTNFVTSVQPLIVDHDVVLIMDFFWCDK
jgi:hypothetical protein